MKLRGNPPNLLVEVAVLLKGSGIQFNYQDLEITYMAEKPNISGPNELIEKHKEIIRLREQSDRE